MLTLTVTAAFMAFPWFSLALAWTIPVPYGPYGIGTSSMELTYAQELDPFAPSEQRRRIMVSAFYPVTEAALCQQQSIPYMPPSTASVYTEIYGAYGLSNGTLDALELIMCRKTLPIKHRCLRYPIVLFSPGLGDSRLLYSAMAGSIAAQGFVVVTIDHTYDAAVVEFPDGELVFEANITTKAQVEHALAVRRDDMSFVLDQLHNHTITQNLLGGLYGSLNLMQTFVMGHSLGGATAAAAMVADRRMRAGIDLDGTFWGRVLGLGLDRPLMIFAHEGKNLTTDESWAEVWPRLNSSKVEASISGTAHGSYTDLPLLVDVLGLRDRLPAGALEGVLGSIRGKRMIDILNTYTRLFFGYVMGQPLPAELHKSVPQFPEIEILQSRFVE